jgi:hypothetical protein
MLTLRKAKYWRANNWFEMKTDATSFDPEAGKVWVCSESCKTFILLEHQRAGASSNERSRLVKTHKIKIKNIRLNYKACSWD